MVIGGAHGIGVSLADPMDGGRGDGGLCCIIVGTCLEIGVKFESGEV